MKKISGKLLAGLVILSVILNTQTIFAQEKINVTAGILPLKYFIERIGGASVNVDIMLPPGADPHTYEPRPRQLVSLSGSKAYFSTGVPFETVWLPRFKAANRELKIIHADSGIKKHEGEEHHSHSHGHHAHCGADPHIWLSPVLVLKMAENILNGLIEIDPTREKEYTRRFGRFSEDIEKLDRELRELFSSEQGKAFIVFHPAWGYFAREYGLVEIPIEVEGKEPKPAELRRIIQTARERDIKVIFVQPQFSRRSAEAIARSIGGKIVVADPLAENWMENLREVALSFKSAVR